MQSLFSARVSDRFPLHEGGQHSRGHCRNYIDLEQGQPTTNTMSLGVPRIQTEVQVMFFDTDVGGVVHNIAYLRFIEIARTLLAEELGLPLAEMAVTQRYPVVVRTDIDYRRGAKLGDKLVIVGWLERLHRVRFWCRFKIVRSQD